MSVSGSFRGSWYGARLGAALMSETSADIETAMTAAAASAAEAVHHAVAAILHLTAAAKSAGGELIAAVGTYAIVQGFLILICLQDQIGLLLRHLACLDIGLEFRLKIGESVAAAGFLKSFQRFLQRGVSG